MAQVNKGVQGTILSGFSFVMKQQRDWKVTAIRSSINRFIRQMTLPYLSIYTVELGASKTQLGIINSIGTAAAGILSPFVGWLIDRIGTKRLYLIGIGGLAASYLAYGVAGSWPIIIFAMIAYWLGFTVSQQNCAVICGNSLAREDRATAMSCCETFAAGLLGMAGPLVGAFMVTRFGGLNVTGIRPIFFASFVVIVATLILILTQLSNRTWGTPGSGQPHFLRDMSQVLSEGKNLKRWLVISSIAYLPFGMLLPYTHLFASEVKGATPVTIGAMATAFSVTPLLLGIPLGRLADKIGRKRVQYLVGPLFWASNLILIWAPNATFLVISGVLQGFLSINLVISGAMTFELVPAGQMGRWMGIVRFFRSLLAAGGAYLAGFLWDTAGPEYLFLLVIGLDILVRIPLLIGMPETLRLEK